jgi:hypothetical protein
MIYLPFDFSYFTCHDTLSYYDTTLTSLFINCYTTLDFLLRGTHHTTHDTLTLASLKIKMQFY